MGNFSVSHYTRLDVSSKGVEVTYVLDLAEVPTYTLLRDWKLDANSPQANLEQKAAEQVKVWAQGLEVRAAGKPVEPKFVSAAIRIAGGAGGLSVARITSTFEITGAEIAGAKSPLTFEDHNFPDRAGWKEIVIGAGAGAELISASQGRVDRSKALTEYPADPTVAPPQDLRASLEWTLTGAPVSRVAPPKVVPIEQPKPVAAPATPPPSSAPQVPQPAGTVVKGDFLSRLLAKDRIGWQWLLLGLIVAFGLGGAHALEPGHGKTIVAAYLVGSRGTLKHAAILGGVVTFTHTISVFLLGIAMLLLSKSFVPERVIRVLEAVSGLSIVAIGAVMLIQRLRRLRGAAADHHHHHSHDHGHSHGHSHDDGHSHAHQHAHPDDHDHVHSHTHDHVHPHAHEHGHAHPHEHPHEHLHTHDHGPHGHSHVPAGDITLGNLMALGVSGGLVPCPAALVIMLAAIAFGHVGAGLVLLVAFSLGLAGVLMAVGMMVLYAKSWLPDPAASSRHPLFRLVPVISAIVIMCIGLVMTGVSLGWLRPGLAV